MIPFTQRVIQLIQEIPRGQVCTYKQLALMAGSPNGSRQVAWILHSSSNKYDLPWHRVLNSKGYIVLSTEEGRLEQRALLFQEGVTFLSDFQVDLDRCLWHPRSIEK